MGTRQERQLTTRKVIALAAGGAVLCIGVSATLAAWTDSEWVFGGNGAGGPGIGTSTFEVEQNTVAPFADGTWTHQEENPGGELSFGLAALALTPGEAVYAPMALRTAADSVAGTVTLQSAVGAAGVTADDPGGLLFDALQVRVATDADPFTCAASAFAGGAEDPAVIADGALSTTGGSAAQALAAEAGSVQYYCFEVSLPSPLVPAAGSTIEDYMGRSVAPAWQFVGASS